ncbi:methanol oxidation system protein MoxJ [Methylopila turkensis]|uniref:Amino acid ABC transporter substrate-binding protein n=1 Tax=Methylopila turkensis TaxID=1437816 RepID=A0A9W6JR04_9HYPH|nr:methanol oxidation system protein MoxJ [Methylopila turkensis]GLK80194.1 amino acid ABC transporter substrate-binding protein [Methylopila turkensis]
MTEFTTRARAALLGAAAFSLAPYAAAEAAEPLRVCASSVEAPYSQAKAQGFENQIAIAVAKTMGREAEFVWSDKPAIYLVRDYLDKNACDVVFGVDSDDERVLATKPYFRTGYVFVTPADGPEIGSSWEDAGKPDYNRFAVRFSTPAEQILKYAGKYEENLSYNLSMVNFEDKRNKYTQVPADKLINAVVNGEADMAIAFASDVARYVKSASKPLRMTMIRDDFERSDGMKIPLHFDQAIGVRKDDAKLRDELNAAIDKAKPQIDETLSAEGIPTLEPNG